MDDITTYGRHDTHSFAASPGVTLSVWRNRRQNQGTIVRYKTSTDVLSAFVISVMIPLCSRFPPGGPRRVGRGGKGRGRRGEGEGRGGEKTRVAINTMWQGTYLLQSDGQREKEPKAFLCACVHVLVQCTSPSFSAYQWRHEHVHLSQTSIHQL